MKEKYKSRPFIFLRKPLHVTRTPGNQCTGGAVVIFFLQSQSSRGNELERQKKVVRDWNSDAETLATGPGFLPSSPCPSHDRLHFAHFSGPDLHLSTCPKSLMSSFLLGVYPWICPRNQLKSELITLVVFHTLKLLSAFGKNFPGHFCTDIRENSHVKTAFFRASYLIIMH